MALAQWISGVDPNYAGGLHTWDHGGFQTSVASHVFRRPDGYTVVVGKNTSQLNQPGKPFTALLDANGKRVMSYGLHGECDYYPPFIYSGPWYSEFVTAAMQSDGKVLMVLLEPNFGAQQLIRVLSDGTPDQSFGPDGMMLLPTGQVFELVVQADDGFLLVGADDSGHHCVRRRLASGAVDTAFGIGGSFVSTGSGAFNRVELLASGKILLAGTGLARLNTDGTLDTTFGSNGWSTEPFFNSWFTLDMAEQPNGKVLVCGSNKIRRLLPDGNTLDPVFPFNNNTFNGATRIHAASDGSWYYLYNGVSRRDANDQPDNTFGSFGSTNLSEGSLADFNLVDGAGLDLFGYVQAGEPFHYDVAIERKYLTGAPVSTWGVNGRMELNGNGAGENVDHMVVGNDGHLWTVGSSYQGQAMMARFLPGGTPDLGFAYGGAAYGPSALAKAIGVRSDGSAVVGGSNPIANSAASWVHLVGTDGSIDPVWSREVLVTGTGNDNQRCQDLLVLPDDRTVVLINMSYINGPNGWNSAVVMLDANGNNDPAFGVGGQVLTDTNGPSVMSGIARLPGGGLLCTGTFINNGVNELFAYALDIDGQPLSGFGTNGVATISVQPGIGFFSSGRPVVRQDGSFYMLYSNGSQSWVSRILADGTLDMSFANGSYVIDPFLCNGQSMGLLSNGDLLVSGNEYYGTLPILKLDATGALVNSFGIGGVYTINDTANVQFGRSLITVLPGDTVLIAGDLRNLGFWDKYGLDAFLFRFDADFNVVAAERPVKQGVQCMPNPNSGSFGVRSEGAPVAASLSVRDLSGRLVNAVVQRTGDAWRVDLPASVWNGVYSVTVSMPSGTFTEMVVVQR